jgi:hypothetical protein
VAHTTSVLPLFLQGNTSHGFIGHVLKSWRPIIIPDCMKLHPSPNLMTLNVTHSQRKNEKGLSKRYIAVL